MGYYIRYFVEEGPAPSEADLAQAFAGTSAELREGEIVAHGRVCGALDVSTAQDTLFSEEIEEFREFLVDVSAGGKARVLECLDRCNAIIAVQVLFGGGGTETTLNTIDPLWAWLFANRPGLLQADGEGFYNRDGLIIELA